VECMIRQCSVGPGHTALWFLYRLVPVLQLDYTARLGGPPREAMYTVALRGVRLRGGMTAALYLIGGGRVL
jgi:hypothetical protein